MFIQREKSLEIQDLCEEKWTLNPGDQVTLDMPPPFFIYNVEIIVFFGSRVLEKKKWG